MRVWIITEMPNWGDPDAEVEMLGRIRTVCGSQHTAMDRLVELEADDDDAVFIAQEWEVAK